MLSGRVRTLLGRDDAPCIPCTRTPVVRSLPNWHLGSNCYHRRAHTRCTRIVVTAAGSKSAAVLEEPDVEDVEDDRDDGTQSWLKKDPKDHSPYVLEKGAPPPPIPGEYQQTLMKSFTIGGIGLHTGEYTTVRVRPAFANEGRYFVRVPEGTNEGLFEQEKPSEVPLEEMGPLDVNEELEASKIELFTQYLVAQDMEGFEGTFLQYMHSLDGSELLQRVEDGVDPHEGEYEPFEEEEIVERGPDELFVPAELGWAHPKESLTMLLGNSEGMMVVGAELLLAALEMCGVDNARIELEGGHEIPAMDGSAQGWALQVQFAGVRNAPLQEIGENGEDKVYRQVSLVPLAFTVTDGDSFMTFVPEANVRITAGVEGGQEAPVIGKQWFSWSPFEDLSFIYEVAPARNWVTCPERIHALQEAGYLQGGAEGVINIAQGDSWYDLDQLRFARDEPARHEVLNTLGFLTLNAKPGHSGVPLGHVLSYKAHNALRLKFLRALRRKMCEESWQEAFLVPALEEEEDGEDGEDGEGGEEGEDEMDEGEMGEDEMGEGEMEGEMEEGEYEVGEGEEGAEDIEESGEAESDDDSGRR